MTDLAKDCSGPEAATASPKPPAGVSSSASEKPVFVNNSVKRDLRDTTPTLSTTSQPIGGPLTVINGGSDNIAAQPNTNIKSPSDSDITKNKNPGVSSPSNGNLTLGTVSPTPSGSFTLGIGAPPTNQPKNPSEVKIWEPSEKDKLVTK